ncbi:hypothetical protein RRG08_036787 [Elysia crispata]|uniref:Uncharacterized protein n=1 Tax=Elysia crispata TaxID=231223 RepID=A0AAE1DW56_9GAST|nr:hypothetical protein RRG08_036787 [Elysia crispata]
MFAKLANASALCTNNPNEENLNTTDKETRGPNVLKRSASAINARCDHSRHCPSVDCKPSSFCNRESRPVVQNQPDFTREPDRSSAWILKDTEVLSEHS